ncbi:EamA family transporter RarD [Ureibacillus thermosphaericus]|uniref:EamA family transporter RarD n=1 Tax=Ureibacillus thermosphaericus TaxID=51173 RepID=UPI0002F5B4CB|nr:EamA family transporter RarD [Ureibacillus thermosphaericus]
MFEERKGMISAMAAYIIWGFFPVYWKLLEHVNSIEILLNRIIWSFIFTTIFIFIIGQKSKLIEDLKWLWQEKKTFFLLLLASFVISCNWFLYIWAVTNEHVVETSLGYYINPLITVLLGLFLFKEQLSKAQIVAVFIAFIGVALMTIRYGKIPWVALGLACSFAVYGALKKKIQLDATRGLAIETLFILPFALVYYGFLMFTNNTSFLQFDWKTDVFLMLGGLVTAYPLILFAKGAQALPQSILGFIQYFSPTIILILGTVVYKEPFTNIELISFGFIWLAILLFSLSTVLENRKKRKFA